ncbi:MAG: tyrosine-type recombinase/integrase [Planctomycetaceae bacterium]|nr:tyrosine-type recombinase/integrase [Planctomycetaceae bacterium]
MRYLNPLTGKQVSRSTGIERSLKDGRKLAEREAAKWEADLQNGRYAAPSKIEWKQFRERYELEKLTGMSASYAATMRTVMAKVEATGVQRLSQVNSDFLSRMQALLRAEGVSETTIRTYFKHLRAALSWAVELGMLPAVPRFVMPKRAKLSKMKGRPITTEEFERMLTAAEKLEGYDVSEWKRFLTGLWLSGLRLSEALALSWDGDAVFSVDLSGKHPQFFIHADGQKSHRDERLPMTPDFAEWLLATPECDRTGPVFPMRGQKGSILRVDAVGRVVSTIGETAGVVVSKTPQKISTGRKPKYGTKSRTTKGRANRKVKIGKFATAHDLRRSFGTRWSKRVKPATLQKLMRHADIKTTMDFYVQQDADDIAADLWRDHASPDVVQSVGSP